MSSHDHHKHIYKIALYVMLGIVLVSALLQIAFGNNPISAASDLLAQASVGLSAAVSENPTNLLMEELRRRERAITLREEGLLRQALQLERERAEEPRSAGPEVFVYMGITALVLLSLIATNFYFDYRRSHRPGAPQGA
jgi:hypothetical protein